jgi:hypothetical protein
MPTYDGDNRLRHVRNGLDDLLGKAELHGVIGQAVAHLLDVSAGAEGLLVAADDNDPHRIVDRSRLECVPELDTEGTVDGVAGSGAVELEREYSTLNAAAQGLFDGSSHSSIFLTACLDVLRLVVVGRASTKSPLVARDVGPISEILSAR